ncbi:class I SAM-dependent methyltransferase [Dongia deserti]|uniref:class I SAM-dependent methyltransferase n=1 Tax=Dongia deserti TaxID=2268030 RepID=UPI000E6561AE|nr:class I SAM-dependent methyltransferase [Dongia deserti]
MTTACETRPSAWVAAHAGLIPAGSKVLDLAAGSGRHTRYFKNLGCQVTALDRDVADLHDLTQAGVEVLAADLEDGSPWPLGDRRFDGIIVTNYLHRPLFPHLAGALAPGGVLIYETFGQGNERFGKPSNPDFLLRPGELLEFAATQALQVLAYECGDVTEPRRAVVQRMVAQRLR